MGVVGPNGVAAFGWTASGGGGGGSLQQGLLLLEGVCGVGSGPTPGLTTWVSAALIGATLVSLAFVNNNPEMNVTGSVNNNFTFDTVTGTIDRAPNIWAAQDAIVVLYKPA